MAVVIRKARLADRREVLRVCKTTWGGWDYVPQYFRQWVKEEGFYVMADGKRIVGLAKYTELAPRELWLEGLRVDPEYRSHGLGWRMSRFMLKAALTQKPVSLRLATGRRNRHSRTLIRRMGLRLKFALWGYEGRIPIAQHPTPNTQHLTPDTQHPTPRVFVPDPGAAFDYIRTTEEYRAAKHLLQHTWQFRTINLELMTDLARQKRIFAYGTRGVGPLPEGGAFGTASPSQRGPTSGGKTSGENIRGLLIIQPGRYESGRLDLSFIEGDRKALGAFRNQIYQFARKYKAKSIAGMARGESMLRHMRGLRMRRWRRPGKLPTTMVYEYPLPKP